MSRTSDPPVEHAVDVAPPPRTERPAPGSRVRAGALLVCVFLLGGVTGVGVARAFMFRELRSAMGGPPGKARAHFRLEAMRRDLDLDEGQVRELETILSDTESERERLMEGCRPGLDDLRERTDARVVAVLRPEQRARYTELVERRKSRHRGSEP